MLELEKVSEFRRSMYSLGFEEMVVRVIVEAGRWLGLTTGGLGWNVKDED